MQKAVRKYLKALESGNAGEAAELFTKNGWVQSPFSAGFPCGTSSLRWRAHRAIRN